ncbi:MAG: hypothetical protein SFW07_01970 [Gammaproteobacteria bacterium]|nr:hypothetical protein [Gammaproteobacteria bacterium]
MTTELSPEIEQQLSALMTSYEAALADLNAREKNLNEHIEKINALMNDLHQLITEANVLKLGEHQLENLKKMNSEIQNTISDSCARFEKTSIATVKNVNEAIHAFKVDDFKYFIEESYDQARNNSVKTVEEVSKILRVFHWKNMGLALGLSLVVAVLIGLYMNAEWPWEIHQTVVKERAAGKALMNAWPHLNKDDQAFLQDKILKISQK